MRSLAVILALLLGACGALEVKDETAGWSAGKLYNEAKEEMASGRYPQAIKYFEENTAFQEFLTKG